MGVTYSDVLTALNGVTAANTTTSAGFDVSKRQLMSIQFFGTAITSGNAVFTVKVSNDGVNYVTYNRLTDNVPNTISQFDTRVGSVTLTKDVNNTTGSKIYFFPAGDSVRMIKVAMLRTTDGSYTATLHVKG